MNVPASHETARHDGEDVNTIIVGAGPAGLAVGACLRRAGIAFLMLEQGDRVGAVWHRHYERLHLHTDRAHSSLPLLPLPKDYPRYPSRLQVIDYLETYARQFQLEPKFSQTVAAARRWDEGWEVRSQDAIYRAPNLVIATGCMRQPYAPTWPGQESFRGRLLHSSEYRSGEAFKGQDVLVVGFGNSGGEIALDLWEHGARPSLAIRGPVNVIPREVLGIPAMSIAVLQNKWPPRVADALNALLVRALVGDLRPYGLRKLPYGPRTQVARDGHIPLIDVGTVGLIKRRQIGVRPGIDRFTADGVVFSGGSQQKFGAVILATGYRARVDAFLQDAASALDAQGTPLSSGAGSPVVGLFFCGFYLSPTGMLREIAIEAPRIASAIEAKSAKATAQPSRSHG